MILIDGAGRLVDTELISGCRCPIGFPVPEAVKQTPVLAQHCIAAQACSDSYRNKTADSGTIAEPIIKKASPEEGFLTESLSRVLSKQLYIRLTIYQKKFNMKKLLLLMAMGVAVTAGAQNDLAKAAIPSSALLLKDPQSKTVFQVQSPAYFRREKTAEQWQKLRRAGIILTSGGIACIAGGIALVATGEDQSNNGYNYYTDDTPGEAKIIAGVMGIAGGITALGGGITMWAIGNNRLRKYSDRMSFDMGGRSATLAYKF